MKLSHSQLSRYTSCARNYKYYYIDKLRETSITSFLPFGYAIDQALNIILENKKNNTNNDYVSVFLNHWMHGEVNKIKTYLPDATQMGYAKADMCIELLSNDDIEKLTIKVGELVPEYKDLSLAILVEDLQNGLKQKSFKHFPENKHKMLNNIFWYCMKNKGLLMLKAYIEEILPQIQEVVEVQKTIELTNDKGNTVIGVIDSIVKINNELVILDNKTSASMYEQDDVKTSSQLATYCFATGINKAGFAVMLKSIKLNKIKTCVKCNNVSQSMHKTCNSEVNKVRCNGLWSEVYDPKATTQLFIDNISKETQAMVIENYSNVERGIEANVYPQNFSMCHNWYGNKCVYYKLCWENKKDNLQKVD